MTWKWIVLLVLALGSVYKILLNTMRQSHTRKRGGYL